MGNTNFNCYSLLLPLSMFESQDMESNSHAQLLIFRYHKIYLYMFMVGLHKIIFIYLFLAAVGLHCCTQAFL